MDPTGCFGEKVTGFWGTYLGSFSVSIGLFRFIRTSGFLSGQVHRKLMLQTVALGGLGFQGGIRLCLSRLRQESRQA